MVILLPIEIEYTFYTEFYKEKDYIPINNIVNKHYYEENAKKYTSIAEMLTFLN